MPTLGLLAGDRLEPSHLLPNVSELELLVPPFMVLFWRQSNETITRRRHPLFNVLGVTSQSLSSDVLHMLHLGTFKAYCCASIWHLINADVFDTAATNAETRQALTVQRLRHELFAWYKHERETRPLVSLYERSDLTPTMLGTSSDPHLATKAAETGTLVDFCVAMMASYEGSLGPRGRLLSALGDSFCKMRRLMGGTQRL